MAKKVDVTFKNPVNEAYIDHLELWRKTGIGGTFAQIGTDFTFVTGTADYTYADLTASTDSETYYYEARAYNNNGGEIEGTDYNKIAANVTISGATGWIAPVSSYSYDSIPKDISALAPAGETVGAYSFAVNQAQTKMWIIWRSTKQVTEHALTGTIDVTSVTTPITTSAAWSLATPMDLSILDSDDCLYVADYGLNKIVAVPMPTANDLSSIVGSPIPTTTNFFAATQPRSAMVKAIGASDYLYYTVTADKTIRKRLMTDPKDLTTVAGTDAETLDTSAVVTAGNIHSIKFSTDGLNMYLLQAVAGGPSKVHRYLLSGDGTLTGATFQESVTFTESIEHRGMFIDGEQLILGSAGTGVTDTLYNYVGA